MLTFLLVIHSEKARTKLEEIYIQYHRELFVTAYTILKDYHEAEDMVQNVILKLSNNLEKNIEIKCKKTRSYLVIIVRNLSINAYNRKKENTYIPFDEIARNEMADDLNLDEHVLRLEESEELAKHLADIHQPYADILTLRYYHQLSISEIANALEITDNNVSVRISRAKKALKSIIEKGGIAHEETI
ncbi:RNA polymerase sigma factor [bacterium AH-315-G05]|nr:RNA polymerase sigma factor [bacterium AH-315-G05]